MSASITLAQQERALEDSRAVIKQQILLMRKSLEVKSHFMDALKHASTFLNELRTNTLTPKQYYELYIMVYDGLEYFSQYLKDTHPDDHLADLYELVQYAGNIVPRLYLMITVGSVYMSVAGSPVKEIMSDMLEMSRGVQHPIRGLFLRYYLSQRTKGLLSSEMNGKDTKTNPKGNLNDSIKFIITNFIEMNKLWVRWQHQGHSSEYHKRLEERKQLQVLVGSNLVRLSQLDNVDRLCYKQNILPAVLEQIVKCRDVIAQEYLLDVIIQVFPDEFHLITMDEFFNATLRLDPEVNVGNIVLSLVNRLIGFKTREPEYVSKVVASDSVDIFDKMISFIDKISELKPDMTASEYCTILEGLCKLTISYYPEKYANVDVIFKHSVALYKDKKDADTKDWKDLLLCPVETYPSVKSTLNLGEHYLEFFKLQSYDTRKSISMVIIKKFLGQNAKINTKEEITSAFNLLEPLIDVVEPKKAKKEEKKDTSKFKVEDMPGSSYMGDDTEQEKLDDSLEVRKEEEFLGRFMHLIYHKNPYKYFELVEHGKKGLESAKKRVCYTYPSLVNAVLRLVRKLQLIEHIKTKDQKVKAGRMLTFISGMLSELEQHSFNALKCFNMNLMGAAIADEVQLVDASYDFFTEALLIYEQFFLDSRSQYQALMGLINKLISAKNMIQTRSESFDKLITRTTIYSSKLLRKTDQCRAVYMSSHLWWIVEDEEENDADGIPNTDIVGGLSHLSLKNDGKRVLECLQKSLRIADSILDNNVSLELFIEILNQSVYFFIHGNDLITVRYLNGLIELIRNNFRAQGKIQGPFTLTLGHFQRTLKYIGEQKSIDSRFDEIVV